MKVRNVTTDDVIKAVNSLNEEKYGGNIVLESISEVSKTTVRFKVGALNSRELGTRKSASGRRGKYACTHVFEDIMREVIADGGEVIIPGRSPGNPDRHQRVIDSDYDLDLWVESYNCTNVGSMMEPAYPEYLCNHCEED